MVHLATAADRRQPRRPCATAGLVRLLALVLIAASGLIAGPAYAEDCRYYLDSGPVSGAGLDVWHSEPFDSKEDAIAALMRVDGDLSATVRTECANPLPANWSARAIGFDLATTAWGLSAGFREANPVWAPLCAKTAGGCIAIMLGTRLLASTYARTKPLQECRRIISITTGVGVGAGVSNALAVGAGVATGPAGIAGLAAGMLVEHFAYKHTAEAECKDPAFLVTARVGELLREPIGFNR